jgi:hypothetical protein
MVGWAVRKIGGRLTRRDWTASTWMLRCSYGRRHVARMPQLAELRLAQSNPERQGPLLAVQDKEEQRPLSSSHRPRHLEVLEASRIDGDRCDCQKQPIRTAFGILLPLLWALFELTASHQPERATGKHMHVSSAGGGD